MTLDQFRKEATHGTCHCCYRVSFIRTYMAAGGQQVSYCFVCSNTSGALGLPSELKPILAALSMVLDTLKPPKKPKQPKTEGPAVHPMRPRRAR